MESRSAIPSNRLKGLGPAAIARRHVRHARTGAPYRAARPHCDERRGNRRAGARAQQHPRLGRAIERGEYRGSRAADRGHRPEAEAARRQGHRRRLPRRGVGQRARRRARLLRRSQGDRVSELTTRTIADLRDGFRGGEFSAREVAEAFNAAVAGARALNAFAVETPEDALAAADAADAARGKGETGALAGIPLGIKDLFATEGVDTTAGSRILKGFRPPYESTVSANLRKAGAGMLGKLNMDEFAMGSSNETSAHGPVVNPWKRKDGGNAALTPGGSSGGSAAAVAAGPPPGGTRTP